jgi:hypothetical protein
MHGQLLLLGLYSRHLTTGLSQLRLLHRFAAADKGQAFNE